MSAPAGPAAVGVGIGVVSKAVASFGLVHQKAAAFRYEATLVRDRPPLWRYPRWIAGFGCYAMGNLMCIGALTMAPQAVIGALDALVLVFNAVFAPAVLGERVESRDWIANALIVAGISVVVVFAPQKDAHYTSDELLDMLTDVPFLPYAVSMLALCAATMAFQWQAPKMVARGWWRTVDGRSPLYDFSTRIGKFTAFCAAIVPAILSGFLLQLSKIVGTLIKTTFQKTSPNEFEDWPIYMFIVMLIVMNMLQVHQLQRALSQFDALVIVPLFQVSIVFCSVVGGGIYFDEFAAYHRALEPVMFAAGMAVVLGGVAVLAGRGVKRRTPQERLRRAGRRAAAAVRISRLSRTGSRSRFFAGTLALDDGIETRGQHVSPSRAGAVMSPPARMPRLSGVSSGFPAAGESAASRAPPSPSPLSRRGGPSATASPRASRRGSGASRWQRFTEPLQLHIDFIDDAMDRLLPPMLQMGGIGAPITAAAIVAETPTRRTGHRRSGLAASFAAQSTSRRESGLSVPGISAGVSPQGAEEEGTARLTQYQQHVDDIGEEEAAGAT